MISSILHFKESIGIKNKYRRVLSITIAVLGYVPVSMKEYKMDDIVIRVLGGNQGNEIFFAKRQDDPRFLDAKSP